MNTSENANTSVLYTRLHTVAEEGIFVGLKCFRFFGKERRSSSSDLYMLWDQTTLLLCSLVLMKSRKLSLESWLQTYFLLITWLSTLLPNCYISSKQHWQLSANQFGHPCTFVSLYQRLVVTFEALANNFHVNIICQPVFKDGGKEEKLKAGSGAVKSYFVNVDAFARFYENKASCFNAISMHDRRCIFMHVHNVSRFSAYMARLVEVQTFLRPSYHTSLAIYSQFAFCTFGMIQVFTNTVKNNYIRGRFGWSWCACRSHWGCALQGKSIYGFFSLFSLTILTSSLQLLGSSSWVKMMVWYQKNDN